MDELFSHLPLELQQTNELLLTTGFIFFGLIVLELAFDYFSKNRSRDYAQSFVDMGVYLGHEFAFKVGGAFVFLTTLLLAEKVQLFRLPINAATWAAGLVVADFLYYWSHRLEHRSRLFWSWHNVHHSSIDYNGTTALRLGWLEPFVSWYLLVPMVVLGFDPFQVILLFQILLTYQTWIHTKKIGKLGWFEKIFNSPSSHRVHHGSNPEYLDKNFGAVFIIWDRLFGTYEAENNPVKYGLTTNIGTNNPILVNLYEPKRIFQRVLATKGFKPKVRYLFGPPD